MEENLKEKEQIIQEGEDTIARLKDKLEKQKWLYEQFFENKEKIPISKIEQFVQESMKRIVKRKR